MGMLTTICMGHREGEEVHPCGKVLKTEPIAGEDMISHGVCGDCYVIIMGVPPHWQGEEEEYSDICRSIFKHGVN